METLIEKIFKHSIQDSESVGADKNIAVMYGDNDVITIAAENKLNIDEYKKN